MASNCLNANQYEQCLPVVMNQTLVVNQTLVMNQKLVMNQTLVMNQKLVVNQMARPSSLAELVATGLNYAPVLGHRPLAFVELCQRQELDQMNQQIQMVEVEVVYQQEVQT